ncbi:MAG: S46 family peptidase, partial [Longimicrobiales bacterium]|nr:S46 family peptidase [Longimicrobiales bacterium]
MSRCTLRRASSFALFAAFVLPVTLDAQASGPLTPGRFDFGKMWTFEYPPSAHFSSTYGFDASPEWFERARMAALRIPGCSASFVSPNGLVVTNHHCARGAISDVTRPGENLLDAGFYAPSLEEERPIPGTYADLLLSARDVTSDIFAPVDAAPQAERGRAREGAIAKVQERLAAEYSGTPGIRVQVVPLYNGGRYSAYVFRRFTDVRLVVAAELNLGFFGGDPDNFTYPRYALDFAFYRVYDADGQPYRPTHWFTWGDGVADGEPVFVIGNPGPTNRLQTVAQLEYQRDVLVPVRKAFFESRLAALRAAYAADPVRGEELDLRNQAFSLSNSLKAYSGRLAALRDPGILGLKRAAEEDLLEKLRGNPDLGPSFGSIVPELARIQEERRALAAESGAFYSLGTPSTESRTLVRALRALDLIHAQAAGAALAPADTVAARREAVAAVEDHPGDLEEDLLRLRLADLHRHLGEADPLVEGALGGRSSEVAAASLLGRSVLASRVRTAEALERGGLALADDPAVAFAMSLVQRVGEFQEKDQALAARERDLAAELGRARFEVYGTDVAPDATSSPRITDGVVIPYEYNGTLAPTHTTFYGLYDRYYGHAGNPEWALPARWVPAPPGLDLSTPLNFIATADTYGGNSGSPAVTRELALVGLNFDRNVEGLTRDFIYLPERGRNIMVDVRAIREALDEVYDADRIVLEI